MSGVAAVGVEGGGAEEVISVCGKPVRGDVKTSRSRRVVDLDPTTVAVLRVWRRTQLEQRMLVRAGWTETGLVFTMPSGEGWHPNSISQGFDRLVSPVRKTTREELDRRPQRMRFHDLRHTHATASTRSSLRSLSLWPRQLVRWQLDRDFSRPMQ